MGCERSVFETFGFSVFGAVFGTGEFILVSVSFLVFLPNKFFIYVRIIYSILYVKYAFDKNRKSAVVFDRTFSFGYLNQLTCNLFFTNFSKGFAIDTKISSRASF